MLNPVALVRPTRREVGAELPGDDLVPAADVVMDRAFTLEASPEAVWPWIVQLGKDRAGWYLPRSVEHLVPRSRRALRVLDPAWGHLAVGDLIPDYGGPHATFEVAALAAPHTLVYRSARGGTRLTWAITATPVDVAADAVDVAADAVDAVDAVDSAGTRVHLRLRMAPVRHPRLAHVLGGLLDLATVAGLASGLRERLAE